MQCKSLHCDQRLCKEGVSHSLSKFEHSPDDSAVLLVSRHLCDILLQYLVRSLSCRSCELSVKVY